MSESKAATETKSATDPAAPPAKPPEPPEPPKKKQVIVRARVRLHEAGNSYEPGEKFKTTPERAEALGECVEAA